MSKTKIAFNWSGGKDSALALHYLLQSGEYAIDTLLTTLSEQHERISMHGVRRSLLQAQAKALGLPLREIMLPEAPDMSAYNAVMAEVMEELRAKDIRQGAFGDIFLEDLRKYREERMAAAGMEALFPLWKLDTRDLIVEFIGLGFKTVVVCVDGRLLDASFAGRVIDAAFLADLPDGIDPCGENGEFHTFVFDGPIFKEPVPYHLGETVYREYDIPRAEDDPEDTPAKAGFYFKDLIPV